jgi:hypothetical protein
MKKTTLLLLIGSFLMINVYSQNTYTTVKDVYTIKTLTFYGYDFSNLRIADETRIGQPLKKQFIPFSLFLEDKFPRNKMKAIFRKDTLNFNLMPTGLVNEQTNNNRIASYLPEKISVGALSTMISTYQLSEKEGIGYTIIFECFDRKAKTVSAYMVFFDIATKNVLYSTHTVSFDQNGYNYMGDWKVACLFAVRKLLDNYKKEKKAAQAVK